MKNFMDDDLESFRLVAEVLREKVDLPVASRILWNYGSRNVKTGNTRLPDYLQPGYRTYPQMVMPSSIVGAKGASMRVPDKFPPGCEFGTNGDATEFVKFPDGRVFGLKEETGELYLTPAPDLPLSFGSNPSSEASLCAVAAAAANG